MKPARLYVALLALLLIGCSAEVGQQLLAQRRTFNTTLQTIHTAHVAGLLPAAQEKQLLPYLEATKSSLDAADASYAAGDKATADVYSRASLAGLEKLRTILATTQPTTKPTTKPTK